MSSPIRMNMLMNAMASTSAPKRRLSDLTVWLSRIDDASIITVLLATTWHKD